MRIGIGGLIITASLTLSTAPVSAQIFDDDYVDKDSSTFAFDLGIYSDRMFRGQNLYNGTSIQPEARVDLNTEFGTFYADIFSHFATEDKDPRAAGSDDFDGTVGDVTVTGAPTDVSFNELDWELGYQTRLDPVVITAGHTWYTYDESTTRLVDTSEFFGRVGLDAVANPYIMAAYDYDERTGWYYEAGLSQPFPLASLNARSFITPSITMGLSSGLSDKDNHPIYDDSGIAFVDVGVKGTLSISESVALEPDVHYSAGIDDATTDDLWFGMNLKTSFGL